MIKFDRFVFDQMVRYTIIESITAGGPGTGAHSAFGGGGGGGGAVMSTEAELTASCAERPARGGDFNLTNWSNRGIVAAADGR